MKDDYCVIDDGTIIYPLVEFENNGKKILIYKKEELSSNLYVGELLNDEIIPLDAESIGAINDIFKDDVQKILNGEWKIA